MKCTSSSGGGVTVGDELGSELGLYEGRLVEEGDSECATVGLRLGPDEGAATQTSLLP